MKSWTPSVNDNNWSAPADNNAMNGWTRRPNITPDDGGNPTNGANAYLLKLHTNEMVGLWVNNFEGEFGMAGNTAQSKDRRQFFAHNFTAPAFTIGGQTPNSYQYMRLSQFIRQSQLEQMRGVGSYLLKFMMPGGGHGNHTRKDIDIDGYVTTVASGAQRFVNAPPYSFQFMVVRINSFPGFSVPDTIIRDSDHQTLDKNLQLMSPGLSINQIFTSEFGSKDRFVSHLTVSTTVSSGTTKNGPNSKQTFPVRPTPPPRAKPTKQDAAVGPTVGQIWDPLPTGVLPDGSVLHVNL